MELSRIIHQDCSTSFAENAPMEAEVLRNAAEVVDLSSDSDCSCSCCSAPDCCGTGGEQELRINGCSEIVDVPKRTTRATEERRGVSQLQLAELWKQNQSLITKLEVQGKEGMEKVPEILIGMTAAHAPAYIPPGVLFNVTIDKNAASGSRFESENGPTTNCDDHERTTDCAVHPGENHPDPSAAKGLLLDEADKVSPGSSPVPEVKNSVKRDFDQTGLTRISIPFARRFNQRRRVATPEPNSASNLQDWHHTGKRSNEEDGESSQSKRRLTQDV